MRRKTSTKALIALSASAAAAEIRIQGCLFFRKCQIGLRKPENVKQIAQKGQIKARYMKLIPRKKGT